MEPQENNKDLEEIRDQVTEMAKMMLDRFQAGLERAIAKYSKALNLNKEIKVSSRSEIAIDILNEERTQAPFRNISPGSPDPRYYNPN